MLLLLFVIIFSSIKIKKFNTISSEEGFNLTATVILGIGSQIMMLVSPVYGERNTLFGALMIIFFTAILFAHLLETKNRFINFIEKVFYIFLVIISSFNILNIYRNYKITNEIQNKNIKIIEEYKKTNSNEELELSKLKDDNFGWSMPYNSPYHEYWYKVYYKIPETKIIWKDYEF